MNQYHNIGDQQSYQQNNLQMDLQMQLTQEQQDAFMFEKFMNMCATLIQKYFRGFIIRKRHYQVVGQIQKFHDSLWSVVLGWRVRKILKLKRMQDLIQEMKTLIWKRRELILYIRESLPKIPKDYDSQFMRHKEKNVLKASIAGNQQYKFMSNELEPLQKEFLTTINRLVTTGLWVYEDKHYRKNIQTIVTSFTIIDQSKNNQGPNQKNRSQYATPIQSQHLSPILTNQNKMAYTTPTQSNRANFIPQYIPHQNHIYEQQYAYPEAHQIQSMYYQDQFHQYNNQNQHPDYISKDASMQMGSTRQIDRNQQNQENPQKKSIDENEIKKEDNQPLLETKNSKNAGSKQHSAKVSKQNSMEFKQEQQKPKEEGQHKNDQPNDIQEQPQQDQPRGFSWDDVPIGQGRKKIQFDEYPTTIKTDIKPTIPKKKKLERVQPLQENDEEKDIERDKEEIVKRTAKPRSKVQKKKEQENDDDYQGIPKSFSRSQTEIPLVYQGDLDTGTHKSKSKQTFLTQEEREEKEKKDKADKIKNLKKRMKYDPRKAIQNEKNGVVEKDTEEDEQNDSDDEQQYVEQVQKNNAKDKQNRAKSSHVISKNDKENREKQQDDGSGNYLRRKSKNMAPQKQNKKKVESRVDCWSSWNKRSKNYIQTSQTNFINNTPTKRRITLSSHQNQNTSRSHHNNNEFSFAQNKLHSVSEAQQYQQKIRNKFGLNGNNQQSMTSIQNDRNLLSPQQSMTQIKQNNWLHAAMNESQKSQLFNEQPGSYMKLPIDLDYNSLQSLTTGDLLKLREALVPIIQTNLIFVEQNDPKIFTKIAKEILKFSNNP